MKFDIYYKKNEDDIYTEICKKLNEGHSDNSWVNRLREEQLYNLQEQYKYFQMSVCDNAEQLTDFIFMLHCKNDYSISVDMGHQTVIIPHLEKDQLVLNIETHQVRVVKDIGMHRVTVYNTDDKNSSAQKWGHIRTIKEEWDRAKCIPLDMDNANWDDLHYFSYGSALGTHEKYHDIAYHDMCEW